MSVRLSLLCLPVCLHGLCMHVSLPFGQKYFSSHLINRHIHILYLVIFVNMLLDICIRYYCWNSFWIPVKEVLFFFNHVYFLSTQCCGLKSIWYHKFMHECLELAPSLLEVPLIYWRNSKIKFQTFKGVSIFFMWQCWLEKRMLLKCYFPANPLPSDTA